MNRGALNLIFLVSCALAALGIGVIVLLLRPPRPEPALAAFSSRQCLECHADVAAEWQESHHALAYENPEVRKLSNDFRNEECLACHAPRPVLEFAPGERVLERAGERALGVDCLACHAHPDGGVATSNPRPNRSAPCRPRYEPRTGAVDTCGSCHNQHGTVDQWRAAPAAFEGRRIRGEDCLHCHMPEVFRTGGRRGRDHRFQASHHLPSLQAAARIEAGRDAEGPYVSVTNFGAGHNFPTDERSRAADVQVRWQRDGGDGDWQHLHRFRDPYRDEIDLTNTQLPSGQTWRARLTPPAGAQGGEVRLLYRTNPFQPDAEAAEVGRARVPW